MIDYFIYGALMISIVFILFIVIAISKETKRMEEYDKKQEQQKQDLINLKIDLNTNYCPTVIKDAILAMSEIELKHYKENKPIINVRGDIIDLVEMDMQYEESNNINNVFEMDKDKLDNINYDTIDMMDYITFKGHLHLNDKSPYLFTLKDCEMLKTV